MIRILFFNMCLSICFLGNLKAQNTNNKWMYDFGNTSSAPYYSLNSTDYSTIYLPAPQALGGSPVVRTASTNEGPIELVNSKNSGGSGIELKMTGGSVAGTKFGLAGYNGNTVGTFECKFNLVSGNSGRIVIVLGNGSNYGNYRGANVGQIFAGLAISPKIDNTASIEWFSNVNSSSNGGYVYTGTSFLEGEAHNLRFYLNNSTNDATYFSGRGNSLVTNTLLAGTFDVWLDDNKILTNADPSSSLLSQGVAVNSMNLILLATAANKVPHVVYLDDIKYSNFLPTVAITAPKNNEFLPPGNNINITADALDSNSSISKVEFFNGVNKLGEDTTAPYSFGWNNVSTGDYEITVKATNNNGIITSSEVVNISVTEPPTVAITSPNNNDRYVSPATVSITAHAADVDGFISKVEFFNGVNKLGEDTIAPYSFDWANVPSGNYTITVKATDNSGCTSKSTAINVIVTSNDEISLLKSKYYNWLTDADVDYNNPAALERYNQFISDGNSAKNLAAYDFNNPGAVWDLNINNPNFIEFSTLIEEKLIKLVFLYKLKGPAGNPNPDYQSVLLKNTILNIFNYLKVKGINVGANFNIIFSPSIQEIDLYKSVALRCSSYATSILLMKDELKEAGEFEEHMEVLQMLTYFISPTFSGLDFTNPGVNADVLKASCQQRFCYVLAQDDNNIDRQANMSHLKKFIDNGLRISNGWSDFIKPDFMTYHHRGVFSNAYGQNALLQMSVLNMILKNSSYELDSTAKSNLKGAIMNYSKFTKGFDMPRGLSGRFPLQTDVVNSLRPAYAYLYLSDPIGNIEAGKEFVRLWGISDSANTVLKKTTTAAINLLNSMGGIQNIITVLNAGLNPKAELTEGQFNFPYAGLSVHKFNGNQVSMKGTSKYIWNYERSNTENVFGRYGS